MLIMSPDLLTIANYFSFFRIAAAPILVVLAYRGQADWYLILLAVSMFTDACDGYIARKTNTVSDFGAKLDSWGDWLTYLTLPLGALWLWPDILRRELYYVILIMGSYALPILVGLMKFKQFPSYHSWSGKLAAVSMFISVFILFLFDISWPFHISAAIQALVACEELAITFKLKEYTCDVPSFWHLKSIKTSQPEE